jgi:tetratricopeptide (TPR) repeat protein
MFLGLRFWSSICVLSIFPLTGCETGRQPAASSVPRRATRTGQDKYFSADAVENRVEAHAHYATAVVYDLNDKTEDAVREYCLAASLDNSNEQLVLDVTRRLLQLKEVKGALEVLEKSTARPEAGAPLFARLAVIHSFFGNTNQAIEAAQIAINKDPKNPLAYQQLAQIYMQSGNYAEGLLVLRQAAQQAQLEADDLVGLAEVCLTLQPGKSEEREALRALAVDLLKRANALQPTNPILLQRMADGLMVLGEPDLASTLYDRLLERFPHLPGLRERLIDIYIKQQDLDKAAQQLESILRDNPTNLRAHYLLGSLAYENKELEKAEEHFKKVVLLNPDFEQAYYDLAGVQLNLNQPKPAIQTLETARAKFKLRFVTELYSALAFSRLKDFSKAVKHFEAAEIIARAAETNRLTHIFYFQIGAAYERNKQFAEAEQYLRKCLEQEPEFPEALNYLGYMWADRGENLKEARDLIEKALQQEPKSAAYLDSMGWVLFKLNQPEEALDYLRKAVELSDEPDPVLFDHLGDVYATLSQPEQAREAWKKSLALEPNEQIQKKLESNQAAEIKAP